MKNTPRILRLALLWITCLNLFSLFSCRDDRTSQENCETFVVDKSIVDNTFRWPNSIRISHCIRLETNEESLVGIAQKVMIEDNKIFILDRKDNRLKVFSEQGDFLFKIGCQGQGPGEYTELRDFCFNLERNEIFILDFKKILSYDIKTGKFIKKIELNEDLNPVRFYYTHPDLFYLWEGNEDMHTPTLLLWNTKRIVKRFLPYKNYIHETERFRRNGDSCLLSPPNGDFHIYEIARDQFYPKYYIDFGKWALPNSVLITKENAEETFQKSPYLFLITDVLETSKWVYLLVIGNGNYHEVLIDKESKEVISGKPNFSGDFMRIIYTKNDEFYALIEPSQMLELSKESIWHALLDVRLDESDNPLIIQFRL